MTNRIPFAVLGDQHLGRKFITGVPLARRGERERLVWKDFVKAYANVKPHTFHVNMGDIFDAPFVSYDLLVNVANVLTSAADRVPTTTFFILKGNHDLARDLERKSAYDLVKLLAQRTNLLFVDKPLVRDGYAFFPYDPVKTAAEYVEATDLMGVEAVFGHWDTNGFGSDHNVLPTKVLAAKGVKTAFTGHVHKPEMFTHDGVMVHVVGSIQPFAFGEQADARLYVEHTLESLETATGLHDKVVRVTLAQGELIEDEVDCLQLVVKRLGASEEDDIPMVTLGTFNMEELFSKAFADAGVSDTITETLLGKYHELRLNQAN